MAGCVEIGTRIKMLREKKKMTQKQLADELHVSRETINLWENGLRDIKTEYTIALAECFHVSCDYILRGYMTEYVDLGKELGLSQSAFDSIKFVKSESPDGIIAMNAILENGDYMESCFRHAAAANTYRKKGVHIFQCNSDEKSGSVTDLDMGDLERYRSIDFFSAALDIYLDKESVNEFETKRKK